MLHIHRGKFVVSWSLLLIPLSTVTLWTYPAWAEDDGDRIIHVDCSRPNGSITKALQEFAHGDPVTISVTGTCHENVVVRSPNVTLLTTDGATIIAADDTKGVVAAIADGLTVDGFTLLNGISGVISNGAQRVTVQNCHIEGSSIRGINLIQSANAVVDHCTLTKNRFGISGEVGSSFTLTNSVISDNAEVGVQLVFGSTAEIGSNIRDVLGGNLITGNGASGIQVAGGSSAAIVNNTITGNAMNTSPAFGLAGIGVFEATVNIAGGNTISGNGVFGVELRGATALIGQGDAFPNANSVNTIVGNGIGPGAALFGGGAGVLLTLGSLAELHNANISHNTGPGLSIQLHSVVHGVNNVTNNNSGDGVELSMGSGLRLDAPRSTSNGNGGFGLDCLDAKSSVAGDVSGLSPISPRCTGF